MAGKTDLLIRVEEAQKSISLIQNLLKSKISVQEQQFIEAHLIGLGVTIQTFEQLINEHFQS